MRRTSAVFMDSFTEGLDELPQYKQANLAIVLRHLHDSPRKRFSVFEASANQKIAVTMTRICQEGYIDTDNSCGYPWTKYKLSAKGLRVLGITAPATQPTASPVVHSTGERTASSDLKDGET